MFLILLALVAGALGFRSGIIRQVGSIAGIVAGIIACRMFGPSVVEWTQSIAEEDTSEVMLTVISYAGIFIVAYFALLMCGSMMRSLISSMHLSVIDRVAGAAFKILLWGFGLSIILNVWCAFLPHQAPDGVWAQRVEAIAPVVMGTQPASILFTDADNQQT